MAGGFKWSLDWDTNPLRKGGQQAADAIEDTIDVFEDMARQADRSSEDAGDSLDDNITDGTKAAAKSVDKFGDTSDDVLDRFKKAVRDAADDAEDKFKKSSKSMGDDVKRGTSEAEDGLGEFKDEANSTAKETAASFDGSADSIAGAFQEVAANALGGFGPAGALAGLALAAGIGTFWTSFQENSEKAEQRIADMYDDMLESGADFLSKEFISDQLKLIYEGAEDAAIKIKDLRDLATKSEIPEPLLARALVGDKAAREEVKSEIARQRLKINEALDQATAKGQNMAPAYAPAIKALQDVEAKLGNVSEATSTAQRNAQAASAAINGIIAPTQGAARSAEDARSKFDGLGRAIGSLPDKTIRVGADTSQAERQIRQLTDKTYTVTVNGKMTGVKYY